MGFNFDPDALPKAKQSAEGITEYVEGMPAVIALLEDVAKQSGAKKFQDNVENMKEAAEILATTLKGFVGEEGDKASAGTLMGGITAMKGLDATMNG